MLEKPGISDGSILTCLQENYALQVRHLQFLPLGADPGTAVYRVAAEDRTAYFLKLRKGFQEITVTVPLFLKSQGMQEIIAPVETGLKQGWVDFGEYTMILYPFIEGKDGFETEPTARHKQSLGAALRRIHTLKLPPELKTHIPAEAFDPHWREILKDLQRLVRTDLFDDPAAASLAEFMRSKEDELNRLIVRTEQLASRLRSEPLELVLCHTDLHGGNLLIADSGELYIVDWDNPLLAPPERDLMFIGGGIDNLWNSTRQLAMFYGGYGKVKLNMTALAYYRYERIIEDLAVIGEQLFLTDEGGADRSRSLGWFTSNFEPRGTIHIARVTDTLGRIDH